MAVDKMFNVTYWPYVQVSTAYNCMSLFFADSYFNLKLNTAATVYNSLLVFGVAALIVTTL
jgi:hypothetical protein